MAWSSASAQSLLFRGTEPRVQLTGEDFQIMSNGIYFTDSVPGRSLSQAGVLGSDLGFPVVYPDKIVILFGDTLGVYQDSGRFVLSAALGDDSIGYLPNIDLSQCHYISSVAAQIAQGNAKPAVGSAGCPALQFYLNPSAGPKQHRFQSITINDLQSGEGLGSFQTPSGAIDYANRLYVFYIVKIQDAQPHLALQSIMARSDQPSSAWTQTNPPTFTRLYTVSSHPPVPNPGNPPSETNATGKFMFNPPVVLDRAILVANAIAPGLPLELQSAGRVVFVFGSSFRYNRSNLYLAAFNLSDIEKGTPAWFYYAGQTKGTSVWTKDERMAAPLLDGDPRVGNHTVLWNGNLRRFVLMHGNIVARASATPWGPWSEPFPILDSNSAWGKALIHHPGQDRIARTVTPIYHPATQQLTDIDASATGIPYGPNLIDKSTVSADGSVTMYYTMSTWNPYQVFLTSSTFAIGPQPAPVVSAASYDGAVVAPGSVATILGSSLSQAVESAPSSGDLPTTLGGVSVTVQDSLGVSRGAGLYYVSPGQINFVVPDGAAPGPANINVMAGTSLIFPSTTKIAPVAPALFSANASGAGAAAALALTVDASGGQVTQPTFVCGNGGSSCASAPIELPSGGGTVYLEFYGTGIRGNAALPSVAATLGGIPARVVYAGPQPQYPGLDQVNVEVPRQLRGRGIVDLVLLVGGRPANIVNVAFK